MNKEARRTEARNFMVNKEARTEARNFMVLYNYKRIENLDRHASSLVGSPTSR
jgi:hypothetical protein